MNQFISDENMLIEASDNQWRMRRPEADSPALIVRSDGVRYGKYMAQTRKLPEDGYIARADIQQVVIGWQEQDSSWHLGFVLNASLAAERGSRWCELIRWADPQRTHFEEYAHQQAQIIASILQVTMFSVPVSLQPDTVQPESSEAIATPEPTPNSTPQVTSTPSPSEYAYSEVMLVASPPIKPLPELPADFAFWRAEIDPYGNVAFNRTSAWNRHMIGRMVWYTIWSIIYVIVSFLTLTSEIALPNSGTLVPDSSFLPYLGFLTAFILILIVTYTLWQFITQPRMIVADPQTQRLLALRGTEPVWHIDMADIQGVVISEHVKKKTKNTTTDHGEINLLMPNDTYHFLLQQGDSVDNDDVVAGDNQPKRRVTDMTVLEPDAAFSHLQIAALHLGKAMNKPVWHDTRVR